MPDRENYLLSSSPHVFEGTDVRRIMLNVIIALAPSAAWGIWLFGIPAVITLLVSVGSCVAFEALFRLAIKAEPHIGDLSAVVTGMLLALVLPPSAPWWMVMIGAFMAIIVAKEFFGGLGCNPFNPALIGRAVLIMSFPAAITTWRRPFIAFADAATSATPLGILKAGGSIDTVVRSLGATDRGSLYLQLFLGNRAGSLGEASILLVLLGAIWLVATRTIDLRAPVGMLVTAVLYSLAIGQDPLLTLLSGGLVFGAFFMATDYVTAPVTPAGRWIFGIGAGLITMLIRHIGGYPEGVTYAILIMNALSPFLNRLVPKKYGWTPKKKGAAK